MTEQLDGWLTAKITQEQSDKLSRLANITRRTRSGVIRILIDRATLKDLEVTNADTTSEGAGRGVSPREG